MKVKKIVQDLLKKKFSFSVLNGTVVVTFVTVFDASNKHFAIYVSYVALKKRLNEFDRLMSKL